MSLMAIGQLGLPHCLAAPITRSFPRPGVVSTCLLKEKRVSSLGMLMIYHPIRYSTIAPSGCTQAPISPFLMTLLQATKLEPWKASVLSLILYRPLPEKYSLSFLLKQPQSLMQVFQTLRKLLFPTTV